MTRPNKRGATDDTLWWDPTGHRITTIHGEEHQCPMCSWKMERAILANLGGVIQPLISAGVFTGGPDGGAPNDQFVRMLEVMLEKTPERVTDMVATLTGESGEWVDANLNIEIIFKLLIPFFSYKWEMIRQILEPVLQPMRDAVQARMTAMSTQVQ